MAVDIYSKIANELVSNRYHTVLGRVSKPVVAQLDEFEDDDDVENAAGAELDHATNTAVPHTVDVGHVMHETRDDEVEFEDDMDLRMDDVHDIEDVDVYLDDVEGADDDLLEEEHAEDNPRELPGASGIKSTSEDVTGRKGGSLVPHNINEERSHSRDIHTIAQNFHGNGTSASSHQVESSAGTDHAKHTADFELDDSEILEATEDKDEDEYEEDFEDESDAHELDHARDVHITHRTEDENRMERARPPTRDVKELDGEPLDKLEHEDVDNIEAAEDAYDAEDAEEPVESDLDANKPLNAIDRDISSHNPIEKSPSITNNSEQNGEGSEDLEAFFSNQLNKFGSFTDQQEHSRAPPPYDGFKLTSSSKKTSMKDIPEFSSFGELSTSASPPLLFAKKESPMLRKRTPPRLPPPPKRTSVPPPAPSSSSPSPAAITTTPRTAIRKSKEAERKYAEVTRKMKTSENTGLMSEIEKAKAEIDKLRLWHKEVALRRKRTLVQERKTKEVELQEQKALEQKKAEEAEMKQLQRQHLIEFKRLKRAEEQEARRQREEQLHTENKVLYEGMPKTPVYMHLAQIYKDKRTKKHQIQQLKKRGGGGQLSPRRPKSAQSSESVTPPISQPSRPQKQIFKGKAAEGAKLEEQQRRVAVKLQKEGAKAKLHKQTAYAVLVKEMFTPSVDAVKRKEVEQRQATTKNRRAPSVPSDIPHDEPKTIPPEARGKVKPKALPQEDKSTPSTTLKDSAALQFGNIRLVKSAKQVAEEREATVASWQAKAKAVINSINQKEAVLTQDVLTPIHLRFAKHAMVSSMYCDTISAKLDLLSDMRV